MLKRLSTPRLFKRQRPPLSSEKQKNFTKFIKDDPGTKTGSSFYVYLVRQVVIISIKTTVIFFDF